MSLLKKLAGETALYGVSTMLGRLLNYLLVMLHTQLFLPDQLAVQVQLYAYAGLSLVVYTFGMETAYFKYASKEEDRQRYYNLILSAVILVSVSLSGLLFVFAEAAAAFIQYPNDALLVRWMALIMAIDGIVAIPFARLRLEKKAKKFVKVRVLNIVLNIGLNLFFLVLCRDIALGKYATPLQPLVALFYDPALAPAYIILANLVANVLFFALLWREFADFRFVVSWQVFKPVWVYAYPLLIMNLAAVTNYLFDRMMLQFLLPEGFYAGRTTKEAIGIYGQAFKLSIFMNLAIQSFKYAAEPFFFSQAEDKNAPEVFARVMKWFVIVCTLMWVGISLNLDLLAHLFLRNKIYHEGIGVVPWLLLGFLFLGVYYNLAAWFKITGKTEYGTYITLTGVCTTAFLNALLVPRLGYLGCGVAFAGSAFLMMVLCYYYGQRYYPVPYRAKEAAGYVSLAAAYIYLNTQLHFSSLLTAAVYHLLLFGLFVLVVLIFERHAMPLFLRRWLLRLP